MSLNESIVEDAALTWFGGLGYAIGHGESYSEAALVGRLSEAIRRLNPAATVKESLSVQTKEPQP